MDPMAILDAGIARLKGAFREEVYLKTGVDLTVPEAIQGIVNQRCNYRCLYCYSWQREEHREISIAEWKEALRSLRAFVGRYTIQFAGGEPFVKKGFLELLAFCRDQDIGWGVITNGSLLDQADRRGHRGRRPARTSTSPSTRPIPPPTTCCAARWTPCASSGTGLERLSRERARRGGRFLGPPEADGEPPELQAPPGAGALGAGAGRRHGGLLAGPARAVLDRADLRHALDWRAPAPRAAAGGRGAGRAQGWGRAHRDHPGEAALLPRPLPREGGPPRRLAVPGRHARLPHPAGRGGGDLLGVPDHRQRDRAGARALWRGQKARALRAQTVACEKFATLVCANSCIAHRTLWQEGLRALQFLKLGRASRAADERREAGPR